MGCGRKKPPPSSSSSSSQPIFPMSWLSRFKHISISSKPKPGKVKPKGLLNSPLMCSVPQCAWSNAGRFYGGDDVDDDTAAFWRLSFGEENGKKKNRGILKSDWYESDDELDISSSSCRNCRLNNGAEVKGREEAKKLNEMVLGLRRVKALPKDVELSLEMDALYGEKRMECRTPRRMEKGWKLRKTNRQAIMEEKVLELERGSHEAEWKSTNSIERDALKRKPARTIWRAKRDRYKVVDSSSTKHSPGSSLNCQNSRLRTTAEDGVFATHKLEETGRLPVENLGPEWQKLKEMKIKEIKSKSGKEGKSLHVSKDSQRRRRTKQYSKVRLYSPRTPSKVEICKIKPLEDIRKSKLKMKTKAKERTAEEVTGLESFAMVKCSFDPQQDFRDSMLEMIMERRMSRPEELEELLANYLTLNSDEYHDLIIKVFRQVWFDVNQVCFSNELESEDCCND
ncbi:transcription repressor OFP5 [Juglans microcarpa x Juglans regia]|uniref:transcription repressor OFP5 n=1 Tax=Juglans microcarpa x Juglans regia TaxID=2249226 RepID=UPI001B7E05CA|nr:transcription repressor OFP5 [Juglans microcarpa x Juglans regia]